MNWISVEDRLPEPGSRVLMYCTHMYHRPEDYTVEEGWFGTLNDMPDRWYILTDSCCNDDEEGEVTHWMPFPERPE
jgi:hypothetical protein